MKTLIPLVMGDSAGMSRITIDEIKKIRKAKKNEKIKIKRAFLVSNDEGIPCVYIETLEMGIDDLLISKEDVEKIEKDLGIIPINKKH